MYVSPIQLGVLLLCIVNTLSADVYGNFQAVKVCGDALNCTCVKNNQGLLLVDCSNKGWWNIPTSLPNLTSSLDLSHNKITSVSERAFNGLNNLRVLKLYHNTLVSFHKKAFDGISNLETLYLGRNKLVLSDDTYQPGLFAQLKKLKLLNIAGNPVSHQDRLRYPDTCLGDLVHLEQLWMDGLYQQILGPGFRRLNYLTRLVFSGTSGNCEISKVSREMFNNTRHIQELSLVNCSIVTIDPYSFYPLKNLTSLDLSKNEALGLDNAFLGLHGVNATTLEVLKMNKLRPRFSIGVELKAEHLKPLCNTDLHELYIEGNSIEMAENGSMKYLPDTLKYLSFRYNRLIMGNYFKELCLRLRHLEKFDMSHQFFIYTLQHNATNHGLRGLPSILFCFPFNLNSLDMSYGTQTLLMKSNITILPNNLQFLNVSHNWFTHLSGRIQGLLKIIYLDLSNNFCDTISRDFFDSFSSLKTLILKQNNIGYVFSRNNYTLFKKLTNLTYLDLSSNKIQFLEKNTFHGLQSLQRLNLIHNLIVSFNIDFDDNLDMTEIDLSVNYILFLKKTMLTTFDKFALYGNFSLHLSQNPLSCDCEYLYFFQWWQHTTVKVLGLDEYRCLTKSGSYQNVDQIVNGLEKDCASHLAIILGTTGGFLMLIIVILCALSYIYRWKLRYLFYVAKHGKRGHARFLYSLARRGNRGYTPIPGDDRQYLYGAFVSYAEEDRRFVLEEMREKLEVQGNIRLCIHDRDFIPGQAIASNIINAIHNSQKTVIVLTRNFLRSYWCRYEFEIARQESIAENRNALFIILYERIPYEELLRHMEISDIMLRESYIEFPVGHEQGNDEFWQRCKSAINDGDGNE